MVIRTYRAVPSPPDQRRLVGRSERRHGTRAETGGQAKTCEAKNGFHSILGPGALIVDLASFERGRAAAHDAFNGDKLV